MVHRLRQRRLPAHIFSLPYVDTDVYRRVAVNNCRERRKRRFWVKPGRTAVWWQNFLDNIVIPEEWGENFLMSKDNFYKLCEESCPDRSAQHFGIGPVSTLANFWDRSHSGSIQFLLV